MEEGQDGGVKDTNDKNAKMRNREAPFGAAYGHHCLGHVKGRSQSREGKELVQLSSFSGFQRSRLGESRCLATGICDTKLKYLLNKPLVMVDGHVKGSGLARRASAHCEVFLRKGKGAKAVAHASSFSGVTARDH
jgi:hypothetical protein